MSSSTVRLSPRTSSMCSTAVSPASTVAPSPTVTSTTPSVVAPVDGVDQQVERRVGLGDRRDHGAHLDHERERVAGLDVVARRGIAVGEIGRNIELDHGARLAAGQPLFPAGDHAAAPEHEIERDAAQVAGVEHLAGRRPHAGVVDDQRVAGGGRPCRCRVGSAARRVAVGLVHGRSACGIDALGIVGRIGHVLALGESTSSASGPWSRSARWRPSQPAVGRGGSGIVVVATAARRQSSDDRRGDDHCEGTDRRRDMPGDATGAVERSVRATVRIRPIARTSCGTNSAALGHDRVVASVDPERLGAGDPLEQLAPDAAAAPPDRAS